MATIQSGTPENLAGYFRRPGMTVLTFLGYSAADYEGKEAMLAAASHVLDQYPAAITIVNIGAAEPGIGAVYDMAKRKGYSTSGIVSSQAKKENVPLAPCVDHVFYVDDDTWGGKLPILTSCRRPRAQWLITATSWWRSAAVTSRATSLRARVAQASRSASSPPR